MTTEFINVSVVVPTYMEAANIPLLVRRVFKAFEEKNIQDAEVIIVDDNSPDDTQKVCAQLNKEGFSKLRLIVRKSERGLSSAVLKGFAEARGSMLLCMDADLQHPPESVPDMISALRQPGAGFVLGTRYGGTGGVSKDWPLHRRIISWGARLLARPLSPLSDPMSGFFGVKRAVLDRGLQKINPIGYKIALEVYVKCGVARNALREVNFLFGTRNLGESKLSSKVMVYYVLHLRELYTFLYFTVLLLVLLVLVAAAVGCYCYLK
ncbi:Dolichol-phosphate mannosyltransferase [Diplonema papillatum]|nr:Dolichol-phosphate mannosyltransferase [Diplonema papillatum]